jgi:tetratricopeptide (TPR) repeat protein
MSKKEKGQKNSEDPHEIDIENIPLFLEQDLARLKKLIEGQEFETEEQVDKYLDNLVKTDDLSAKIIPESPLEKAQQLAYDAWEAPTRKEAIKLAEMALEISKDCADAYNILAEEKAYTLGEAIYYYNLGVEAGERALGPVKFKALRGIFWGEIETRPYMRAMAGLAECLWEAGKRGEAIKHYKKMLRLNPGDNQGVRYILAAHYLELGDIDYLKKLLERYDEPSADWLYTRALVIFIEQGNSAEARSALALAHKNNRYVVPYLTGHKKLPRRLPVRIGLGDRREAINYAAEFRTGWLLIKGAIDWLSAASPEKLEQKSGTQVQGIPKVFLEAFDPKRKREQ